MKQSHWFLCVAKNVDARDYSLEKFKTYEAGTSCGMKTYSESKIELRNLQILKKMPEKASQFFRFLSL